MSQKSLSKAFFVRLLVLWGLTWCLAWLLTSPLWETAVGRNLLTPEGLTTSAIEWLGLALIFFFLLERKNVEKKHLRWPTVNEVIGGMIALGVVFTISTWLTHPPHRLHDPIQAWIASHALYGGSVMESVLYTAHVLPFIPLTIFFLPAQFYRLRWHLVFLITEGLIFMSVIEGIYHHAFNPTITRLSAWMTGLFIPETTLDLSRNLLQVGNFSVHIGPTCSGISSILLFVFLFAYMAWYLSRQARIHWGKASMVFGLGLLGIFLLNIVRIAAIMLVGTKYPDFAVGLFHSSLGGILFFVFFLGLLPVMRRIVKKSGVE